MPLNSFKKSVTLWLLLSVITIGFVACERAEPTQVDGALAMRILISDGSGVIPVNENLGYAPVSSAKVTLQSQTYSSFTGKPQEYTAISDSLGWAEFNGLPVARYLLTVQKSIVYFDSITGEQKQGYLVGSGNAELTDAHSQPDTIQTILKSESPLVINEIYYAGPKNNAYYFYDQFVELYNTTDTTVYLDGLILCRGRQAHPPDLDSVNYVQVLYVYQFPGQPLTGRQYPLPAHHFTVIAQDAVNHSAFVNGAVDLSGADWEFYNPYAADIDTAAQNVVNVIPGNSNDFMINLVHNFVLLADGSDFYPGEVSPSGYQYIHVPLSTVLDGVEYSANGDKQKELTRRVDAGFAGVGISKYSGKSVERRLAGSDFNNSSLDFVNINHPTPGYQHE